VARTPKTGKIAIEQPEKTIVFVLLRRKRRSVQQSLQETGQFKNASTIGNHKNSEKHQQKLERQKDLNG
jgi:hypothetical protein